MLTLLAVVVTIVLFSQIIITVTSCLPATINCTVQYYDDITGTVNTTQYCHVDNCTVKIIKTGDVLDIVYLEDQYIIGCGKTDNVVVLQTEHNVSSKTFCSPDTEKTTVSEHIINLSFAVSAFLLNNVLIVFMIRRKLYSSMSLLLLLTSAIIETASFIVFFVYVLMEFVWPVSNTVCIVLTNASGVTARCINLLIIEMFMVIGSKFYDSVKIRPAVEKTSMEKIKMFWIFLTISVVISILLNLPRALIFTLDGVTLINDDDYCIPWKLLHQVNSVADIITKMVVAVILLTTILLFSLIMVLFFILSKRNSIKGKEINKQLAKIAVILMCSTGIDSVVYYTVTYFTDSIYNFAIGSVFILGERIGILFVLSRVQKTRQVTSAGLIQHNYYDIHDIQQ